MFRGAFFDFIDRSFQIWYDNLNIKLLCPYFEVSTANSYRTIKIFFININNLKLY